jgi:DNA-binding NarL/FixJ family response regulator
MTFDRAHRLPLPEARAIMWTSGGRTDISNSAESTVYADARCASCLRLRITTDSASSAVCGAPHTAEFERELIRSRTTEGRVRTVARGVKLGRKPKLTPHQQKEALRRREAGEPMRDIARSYNVSHSTISRLADAAEGQRAIPGLGR